MYNTVFANSIYSIYAPVEAVVPVYEGLNVSISPATVAAPHTTSSSVVDWLKPAADSNEKVEYTEWPKHCIFKI